MKATYFFSEKQKIAMESTAAINGKAYRPKFIEGKEYTEVKTSDGEHKSGWSDAVVVHVDLNLTPRKVMDGLSSF